MQVIVETQVRPEPNRTAVVDEKAAGAAAAAAPAHDEEEEEEQKEAKAAREKTALPVLVTVLLLVPLLLIISTGLFICWRRNGRSEQLLLLPTHVYASVRAGDRRCLHLQTFRLLLLLEQLATAGGWRMGWRGLRPLQDHVAGAAAGTTNKDSRGSDPQRMFSAAA